MNIRANLYFLSALLFFCAGCNSHSDTKNETEKAVQYSISQRIMGYWDYLDKADTTKLLKPDGAEQALVDFFQLLSDAPNETVRKGLITMVEKTINNRPIFEHFLMLFEKYLYDPNSPMRNDKWYSTILEHIVASPKILEIDKVRLRYQLAVISKNNVGTVAENFKYQNFNSNIIEEIHNIKSCYLLLFFYDPECDHCKNTKLQLSVSKTLIALQNKGKLKIAAIYPYSDKKIWNTHATTIPVYWVNGWSKELESSKIKKYDLRAVPSLYLLDKDKKVLLKDATEETIEKFLKNAK